MAGSYGSAFYALWIQQANKNPTAAKQPSAMRFSDRQHIQKIRLHRHRTLTD